MSTHKEIKMYDATLLEKIHEYDEVYSFKFSKDKDISFVPGYYTHLLVGEPHPDNVHKMSLASSPSEDFLLFSMDTQSQSTFKKAFLLLKPGDTVQLFKTKGVSILPEGTDRSIYLIAGGIGVSPYRSMMLDVIGKDSGHKLELVHVARSDFLFEDTLEDLPFSQKRIRSKDLNQELDGLVAKEPAAYFFVSGSERFVDGTIEYLRSKGIADDSIVLDRFDGYYTD